jgi:activator of HSP90 ATPase
MSEPIRRTVDLKASPQRVYEALLDAKQFSAFSGAPARIQRYEGGAFSCFDGVITGRNVELIPNRRIVQAWRVKMWPEGVYSIVTFELEAQGSETRLALEHKGFPDEMRAQLNGELTEGGWNRRYLDPLKEYLS